MANRLALDVVLRHLAENDLLYVAPTIGLEFDPTDYGRSPEFRALQWALDRYYRPPPPLSDPAPPLPFRRRWKPLPWTTPMFEEELEALLE